MHAGTGKSARVEDEREALRPGVAAGAAARQSTMNIFAPPLVDERWGVSLSATW